jgi:hypothetical protein
LSLKGIVLNLEEDNVGAVILGAEGGIPTTSEQKTITFTAANVADIQAACGMDLSDKIGGSITAQFEPTTDKTYYDTKITIAMGGGIHCQVKLTPDTPLLLAMLSDFPLTFAKNLQPGRSNHQVGDSPLAGQPVLDLHCVGSPADATVIR